LATLQDAELRSIGSNDPHVTESEHTLVDRGSRIWPGVSSKSSYLVSPLVITSKLDAYYIPCKVPAQSELPVGLPIADCRLPIEFQIGNRQLEIGNA
jgi:hypothetical protein